MTKDTSPNLQSNASDYIASAVKSIAGLAPFAGSLLAEIAGVIIPNQRLDRIASFAVMLEERLGEIEREVAISRLGDGHFTDLMEEGIRQAARAVSDEKKQHIANLIANSLTKEQVDFVESLHILKMLSELNDIEILWLQAYSKSSSSDFDNFVRGHEAALLPILVSAMGALRDVEREAIQKSYTEHLIRLGLISPQFSMDRATKMPKFNTFDGKQEVSRYEVTMLGRFLLHEIGLSDDLLYTDNGS